MTSCCLCSFSTSFHSSFLMVKNMTLYLFSLLDFFFRSYIEASQTFILRLLIFQIILKVISIKTENYEFQKGISATSYCSFSYNSNTSNCSYCWSRIGFLLYKCCTWYYLGWILVWYSFYYNIYDDVFY